jgi:hypothetical protein
MIVARSAAVAFAYASYPSDAHKTDYRRRHTVERTVAWFDNFRQLLSRRERRCDVYWGFFAVAVLVVCLRRLYSFAQDGGGERQTVSPTAWHS